MIKINNKTKLLCIIILSIIGVYIGFEYILPLFFPFILAYFIAWCLLPVVKFLYDKIRMPKMIGGVLSLITLTGILCWLFCTISSVLIKQITNLLKNMPIYMAVLSKHIDNFCGGCDKFFGIELGTVRKLFYSNMDGMLVTIKTKFMPALTSESLSIIIGIVGILGILLIILVAVLLLIKDEEQYRRNFKNCVFYPDIHIVTSKLSDMGIAYLRTQVILMVCIGLVCTGGLLLIKNKYALLIGIGIGIFDAFPILGSGLILVPWGIISIFNRNIYDAAILFTLYLACQLIRQFLEPRLLGNRIGINPIYTLMSMYVGVNLFGIAGFFLGPLGLVILLTIVRESKARLNLNKEESSE